MAPSLESTLKAQGRGPRPRIDYNEITGVSCSQDVEKEIDLAPLVSGGNIRQLLVRTHVGSGATREPLATLRPDSARLKINGVECFSESEPLLSQIQLLEGYKLDENEDQPYCIPFCLNPQGKDSSGYLPHSNDAVSLFLTFTEAATVDIIAETEVIFERSTGGRIDKKDA